MLSAVAVVVAMSGATLATQRNVLNRLAVPTSGSHSTGRKPISPAALGRACGAMGALVGLALPRPGLFLAPLLCVVGLRVPAILEHRTSSRRRAAIDAQIPQMLDLLAAASSAGLSAQLSLRRTVTVLGDPLAAELTGALHDTGGENSSSLVIDGNDKADF
jgi:Flp pilus assembly protein TadB